MITIRARMMLLLALAASPFGCTKKSEDAASTAGMRPVTMELVVVDDGFDAFAEPAGPLPEGVSLRVEMVPAGTNHYAMLVKKPGETDAQAEARLKPWLSAQKLPPGRRFVLGDVAEENETGAFEPIGLRTYVLTGEAIVTHANVVEANVIVDDGKGPMRQPVVTVTLDAAGGEKFHAATREHVKERIAIVVDGKAMSVPVVQSPIPGGRVSISMQGYDDRAVAEARRLAAGLRGKGK